MKLTQRLKKAVRNAALAPLLFVLASGFVWAQNGFGNQAARAEVERGRAAERDRDLVKASEFYRSAIQHDPYFVEAHRLFINNSLGVALLSIKSDLSADERREQTRLVKNSFAREMIAMYEGWARKAPRNPAYQWGLGEIYRINTNYDQRERYMLNAVRLDPKFVPAYQDLATIAELRGEKIKQSEYLRRVAELGPKDASSAYQYAQSLKDIDPTSYRKRMLEVVSRFPNDERGAQALLQLANSAEKPLEKIAYYERLRASFPPSRFLYSNAGMPDLFDSYLRVDPVKALALAEEMARIALEDHDRKIWLERAVFQRGVVRAQDLINERKYEEALSVLEGTAENRPASIKSGGSLTLQKAVAFAGVGQTARAYQELLDLTISEPTDSALEILVEVGAKFGKTPAEVNVDVRQSLDKQAKPVKDFSLEGYRDRNPISLADHRGKVVLLNFWFPSCVPCRVENPELQRLLGKYGRDKLVILAINIRPEQDEFVVPYLKNNSFDFVPLRGTADFARLSFGVTEYPTNFLIDQQGRVISRLRAVRGDSVRTLELQIELLLAKDDRK